MSGIHVGAIVRRKTGTRQYRVLLILHGPGTDEAEAVLEPIYESWVRRIIAPVANLEVCSE